MPVSQYASTRALRELWGFVAIIAIIAMFAAGKAVLFDTMDPDFFWHIRVAEQLHRDGIGPVVDQLSFSSVKTPWAPYSWLGELGMKWIWDHAGLRGAIATQAILEALFVILALLCAMERPHATAERSAAADPSRESPPTPLMPLIASVALVCFLALPYLSFRPVLAAIDVMAICTLLLLRDRRLDQRSRSVWLVPALTAVTINLHIFAVFIPMWVGALLTGAWIERDRARTKRYAILLALCCAACLCTPMLRGTFAAIGQYMISNPLTQVRMISELEPMYRGTLHQITLGVVALLMIVAIARRRLGAGEMLWLGGMFVVWIKCGRAAPIFVPILAPIVRCALPRLSDRPLGVKWVNLTAATVLLLGSARIGMMLPVNGDVDAWLNRRGPDLFGYPSAAADFVDARVRRGTGRLINEFDWGGYLAWKLPEYQVLLDGRTQLYTPQFWRAAYLDEPAQTTRLLASTEADAAILPAGPSRFRESLKELGWRRAFHDVRADVFVPPGSVASGE